MNEKITAQVGLWKRFQAYHLSIVPSLAGACHEFEFNGCRVKVKLPKKPKQKDWYNENSGLSCRSYRLLEKRKVPVRFTVHYIDVILDIKKIRKIKEEWVGVVNVSLFNRREREGFDRLANKYEKLLDEAFEHWVSVIRWRTSQPYLCQFSHIRQDSRWGVHLIDMENEKDFYAPPYVITIDGQVAITKVNWSKTQSTLNAGGDIPIWQLYYSEAYERLQIGDLRGFIISLAIASETIVRKITQELLSQKASKKYQSMVNTIPVSRILDNWYHIGFNGKRWLALKDQKKVIKIIFELRNGIMHRGENPQISGAKQELFGESVKEFIDYGEKYIDGKG